MRPPERGSVSPKGGRKGTTGGREDSEKKLKRIAHCTGARGKGTKGKKKGFITELKGHGGKTLHWRRVH